MATQNMHRQNMARVSKRRSTPFHGSRSQSRNHVELNTNINVNNVNNNHISKPYNDRTGIGTNMKRNTMNVNEHKSMSNSRRNTPHRNRKMSAPPTPSSYNNNIIVPTQKDIKSKSHRELQLNSKSASPDNELVSSQCNNKNNVSKSKLQNNYNIPSNNPSISTRGNNYGSTESMQPHSIASHQSNKPLPHHPRPKLKPTTKPNPQRSKSEEPRIHSKITVNHNNHRHYPHANAHPQPIKRRGPGPSQSHQSHRQQQSHSQQHQSHHPQIQLPRNQHQSRSNHNRNQIRKHGSEAPINVIRVNGRYMMVMRRIGRGGSCEVFQVMTKDTREILALKKISVPLSLEPNAKRDPMENFQNEIDLLLKVRNKPYCIQMLDYEIENDHRNNCTKIRMLFECGEIDLAHLLKNQPNGYYTDVLIVSSYYKQMLLALNTIHGFRIVHGDLKPANFLMVRGELKLIDFGIAKQIISNETTNIARDSQVGTLNYISPEALMPANNNNDCYKLRRPADVWSMGCILHQMCFGFTPFTKFKVGPKLTAIVSKSCAKYIKQHRDESINEIIKRCLLRNPNDRITVDELLNHRFLNPHDYINQINRK